MFENAEVKLKFQAKCEFGWSILFDKRLYPSFDEDASLDEDGKDILTKLELLVCDSALVL